MLRALVVIATMLWSIGSLAKDFDSWRKFSKGELISETSAVAPGRAATLGLKITLEGKWHTYWLNPGDSGAAINLNFRNSTGVIVKGVHHPIPERLQTGPLVSFGYYRQVILPIDVEISPRIKPGTDVQVQVDAEWLICDDVCIPAIDQLSLTLPVVELKDVKPSPDFALLQEFRARVPVVSDEDLRFEAEGDSDVLNLDAGSVEGEFVDFFPFKGSGVRNQKPTLVTPGTDTFQMQFKRANSPRLKDDRIGVLLTRDNKNKLRAVEYGRSGWSFDQSDSDRQTDISKLGWMLLSAFFGGLILNLMPCVFPVLSMKMISLLKIAQKDIGDVRRQNLAYVAGVLFSFLAIALLLSGLRSAGHLVGWGFQLQSAYFLSFLIWLFFLLSLNFLGLFEIDVLNANLGGGLTRLSGLWGSFFTGVLAVVVASPCTAPFMGVALGFGLSQGPIALISIFLSLGLGLSAPYLLFVVAPGLAQYLPRPGAWMQRLRQFMAFPLLLTVIWLLWILSTVAGTPALFAVLAGCVFMAFGVWLGTWHKHVFRVLALLAVVATFVFARTTRENSSPAVDGNWIAYSPAQLESAKDQNVFINMTADWCLTCKVNEALVFNDPEVLALLNSKDVKLIKGDWTKKDEDITRFLDRYERVGVPFYILLTPQKPEGVILPEVLTKSTFIEIVNREISQ